jgi:manganese/zinc/iron transport system substrate-binding protein
MRPSTALNAIRRSLHRLVLPAASAALLAGCGSQPDTAQAPSLSTPKPLAVQADPSRPIRVLATTTLVADAVSAIGGPRVRVETLIGPGLDPHLYRPRESDLRKLSDAELVFFHGLGLEVRMGEVLRQHHAPLGDSVAIAEAIPEDRLLTKGEGHRSAVDPHVWNDPALWAFVADPIVRTLSEADPGSAADYAQRAADWKRSLAELNGHLQAAYRTIPESQRVLVTAHDAFGYLGRAFGLEVRGLQGLSTAFEAGAADVDALANFLVEKGIRTVFPESSVPVRSLEALQQAVQSRNGQLQLGEELLSDSLGVPDTPSSTYAGMMRQNAQRIIWGLGGDPGSLP